MELEDSLQWFDLNKNTFTCGFFNCGKPFENVSSEENNASKQPTNLNKGEDFSGCTMFVNGLKPVSTNYSLAAALIASFKDSNS
jgi:hypothetical protein